MSGGFFRGTSADQDTRFSNKQAKLLKSQKFASELDHLVDMTKVKMDVIKPWIANRATELLGFEDEVLINFIYGLLDGKVVDGKQIQIQLTGFMEKNTGKFMKELWSLLLSAQKNVSGVPQLFLDAKEEETRKKAAEADRITNEIQKKKEKEKEEREIEQEKHKKLDIKNDSVSIVEHSLPRAPSLHNEEEREPGERHGSRLKGRHSKSPNSLNHSPSHRSTPSETRSDSKSFSNSRSHSDEKYKSRSTSRSPQLRRRSISPERQHRSPQRRSISPHRKRSPWNPQSPSKWKSPHSRRRSTSRSRRRSPSPVRRRSPSPMRRRSPPRMRWRSPPLRHRSPSPLQRRSPIPFRRRSPSPARRPSPRWRSPSPLRHRSPSPLRRRRSPFLRRSPSSLWRRRSPSPLPLPRSPRHRRRSPMKSPRRRAVESQISPKKRNRSRSPYRSRSPPFRNRRSLSTERDSRVNGVESRRHHDDFAFQRSRGKRSPLRRANERGDVERPALSRKTPDSLSRQLPISLRSPQRDPRRLNDARKKVPILSPSMVNSRSHSGSPSHSRRMTSPSVSPIREAKVCATRHDSPETSREEQISHAREVGSYRVTSQKGIRHSPSVDGRKKPIAKGSDLEEDSPDSSIAVYRSSEARDHSDQTELRKTDRVLRSDNASRRMDLPERRTQLASHISEEIEYGPGRLEGESFPRYNVHDEQPSAKKLARYSSPDERLSNDKVCPKRTYSRDDRRVDGKRPLSSNGEYSDHDHKTNDSRKPLRKVDRKRRVNTDSDSNGNEGHRSHHMEKRKSRRTEGREMSLDDDAGYDSQKNERKEAKRTRKEEKKLRKEERRLKREEKHRRKEEKRAVKLNAKSVDTVAPPSDFEKKQNDAADSDGDVAGKRDSHPSDTEETESEQKKLEIELRKKALESLRAKKATSH